MKNVVRILLIIGLMLKGLSIYAQDIKINDEVYQVKKDVIFKNGVDVTNTLSEEEKSKIFAAFNKQQQQIAEADRVQKKLEKAEKEQKRAEKEQRRAEKKQKKAEKALKQREKAQANFDNATKKHKAAINKYEKLIKKGKLSPEDEAKWLEKIEKYKDNIAKAKKKLN